MCLYVPDISAAPWMHHKLSGLDSFAPPEYQEPHMTPALQLYWSEARVWEARSITSSQRLAANQKWEPKSVVKVFERRLYQQFRPAGSINNCVQGAGKKSNFLFKCFTLFKQNIWAARSREEAGTTNWSMISLCQNHQRRLFTAKQHQLLWQERN